ncbi:Homocysteine S-methyltransferase [Sporodiniella umbellata]|nr:Homocysteine S-methyltransferase [Sporodiniella umbellata]
MAFQFPLVLDGGFASELERQHKKKFLSKLWSAECLKDDPEAIKAVHKAYYEAGSNITTTCSYQASMEGFIQSGCSESFSLELMKRSVTLAIAARDEFLAEHPDHTEPKLVALSVGCYGAILANGAEYNGQYGETSLDSLVQFHKKRLDIFLENPVDLILFETVPSRLEAKAIAQLVKDHPHWPPVAVSFQCPSDHQIADGSSLLEALALYDSLPLIFAVGVNCVHPQYIEGIVENIIGANEKKENKKALVLYPNGGDVWNAVERSWDSSYTPTEDKFAFLVAKCARDYGLHVVVGGCCRTGPSHITKLKEQLNKKQ